MMSQSKLQKIAAIACILAGFMVTGCGGSITRGATQNTADMVKALVGATSLAKVGSGLSGLTLKQTVSEQSQCSSSGQTVTCDCETSGSFSLSGSMMTFTDCASSDGTISGEISFTQSGDTFSMTLSNFSGTDDSNEPFSMNGTISVTGTTADYDVTGTFSGSDVGLKGKLTLNASGTIDGSMTVTSSGFTGSCTFTDFNSSTGDYSKACTAS